MIASDGSGRTDGSGPTDESGPVARPRLTDCSPEQIAELGSTLVVASHHLVGTGLFTDEALARMLDEHPSGHSQVFTMGSDPEQPGDWEPVEHGGLDGAGVLEAVRRGRLWVNVRDLQDHNPEYRELYDRLVAELRAHRPDLVPGPLILMIGSPSALVYYHADAGPNLLCHVRGAKTIWVYPSNDPEFAPREIMEEIYAGIRDEELPYHSSLDTGAHVIEVEPGHLVNWPHNSPHRTRNHGGDIDVSFSLEYWTDASIRRQQVVLGNRLVRRVLHVPCSSWRDTGPVAWLKRNAFRAARKLRPPRPRPGHRYSATFKLDPTAPDGMRRLDEPIPTSFVDSVS